MGATVSAEDRSTGRAPGPSGVEDEGRWTAVAVGSTALALGLGLYRLGQKSLWYDEAYTVGTVDRPLGDALWRISHWEVNQSPYYLLFTGWSRLGESEAFLRLLSVGFWVATVPLLYVLGRRMFDARVGAVAAGLFAVHGFALEWGQQLRGYSMVVFGVTLATWLLVRLVDRPSVARGLAYAVVAAVAGYTQFFALLVVLAHAVALVAVVRRAPDRRPYVAAGATLAVLLAPLGLFLLTRDGDPVGWVAGPSGNQLVETLSDLSGGGLAQLAVYGLAVALAALALWRTTRRSGSAPDRPGGQGRAQNQPDEAWALAVVGLWLVVPVAVTVVTSATVKPLLVSRFLLVVVPALVLVAALGVCRLRDRRVGLAVLAALVVVSALGVRTWYDRSSFEDWRGAVATIAEGAEDGDVVVTLPGRAVHAVRYYAERHDAPELTVLSAGDLGEATGEQLWVVDRVTEGESERDETLLEAALARDYELVGEHAFVHVDVRRYQRR